MMNKNKQLVLSFYQEVIGQGNIALVNTIISENYIQHNPMVANGRTGFLAFLKAMKNTAGENTAFEPYVQLIADGDFVATYLQLEFMGQEKSVIDLFRFEKGQIAEHWDVVEPLKAYDKENKPCIDPTDNVSNSDNKSLVGNFLRQVFSLGNWDEAKGYFHPDFDMKHVRLETFNQVKVHQIIGEHNMVLAQLEVLMDAKPCVLYQLFEITLGSISGYWSVKQKVPETMAHTNGMI